MFDKEFDKEFEESVDSLLYCRIKFKEIRYSNTVGSWQRAVGNRMPETEKVSW